VVHRFGIDVANAEVTLEDLSNGFERRGD